MNGLEKLFNESGIGFARRKTEPEPESESEPNLKFGDEIKTDYEFL